MTREFRLWITEALATKRRYLTSFPTASPGSTTVDRGFSPLLALPRCGTGQRGLARRARMGHHGQTVLARGLMLRALLLPCTNEGIPCLRV